MSVLGPTRKPRLQSKSFYAGLERKSKLAGEVGLLNSRYYRYNQAEKTSYGLPGHFDEQGCQWETPRDHRDGDFSYFGKRKG